MPLSVAGAFHTDYMASAREELEGLVGGLRPAEPSRRLLSNADGTAVVHRRRGAVPAGQPGTSPVRFDACLATMRELGVTAVLELPPAGALAGLAKREWKGAGIEILALRPRRPRPRPRTPRAERGRAEAERSPTGGSSSPRSAARSARPRWPRARTLPGRLPARQHPQPPRGSESPPPTTGYCRVAVHEGDLVDAGDPIARLYPEVSA